MEHLRLNLHRHFEPEYYGNDYDAECSFQDFPSTKGWELDTSSGKVKPNPKANTSEDSKRRYPKFMQSWLFFGLIAAVVYDENARNFDYMKLVTHDKGSVNTEHLQDMLQEWRVWEMDIHNARGRKMRMIRAQLALDLARKVVTANCSLDNLEQEGDTDYQGPMYLKPELAMSLMIIGETLTNAKARIIKQIGFHVRGWYGDTTDGWGTPKAVVDNMKEGGWCPRTIKLLRSQLRNNATALLGVYASHDSRASRFKGHELCNELEACKVKSQHPEDSGKYATKHHPECMHGKGTSGCSRNNAREIPLEHRCFGESPLGGDMKEKEKTHDAPTCHTPCYDMFGVDMEDVINLINADKIPLLRFKSSSTLSEKLELELTDHTLSPEYATISHVWSDGYGNTEENKLYRCQLQYFNGLLRWAQKSRLLHRKGQGSSNPEPLPFWMDTLVIPVGKTEEHKKARVKAISQIYNVFSKAKYTVVVDNGLNGMTWDDRDYTTTAMRILASGWMRRLWTLQEAFLSRKLLFAFKSSGQDTLPLVDLDAIEDLYDDTETKLISNLPATAQSYYNNLLGPDRKARIHNLTSTNGVGLIASVWRAAQWRTTSHKEHETLALATLLNLKSEKGSFGTAQLLQDDLDPTSKLDEMMRDFWLVLEENSPGAIPPGIIFLPGGRIKKPGFGWAPMTWMSAHSVDHPDPISLISRPAMLAPQNRGLSVEYPGFLLHYHDRNVVLETTNGEGFWFPSDNTLTEWYHAESADDKYYSLNKGIINESRSEDLAIILCRPRPRQIAEIGLLVEIHETIEQRELGKDDVKRIFAAYILRRITLKRELLEKTIKEKRTEILQSRRHEYQAKIICGEVLDEDQKWYVDCRITSVKEEDSQTAQSTPDSVQKDGSGARRTPYGQRGHAETGIQPGSGNRISKSGIEADLGDETRKAGLKNAENGEVPGEQSSVPMPATRPSDEDVMMGIHHHETEPQSGRLARNGTWFNDTRQGFKNRFRRTMTRG